MHSTYSALVSLLQVVQYIVNAWANGGVQMNSSRAAAGQQGGAGVQRRPGQSILSLNPPFKKWAKGVD
jgi:hypothetical protein